MFPLGSRWKIHDPSAVWNKGHIVTVVGHYQEWPIIRGSGEDRVINPERLQATTAKADREQLVLL